MATQLYRLTCFSYFKLFPKSEFFNDFSQQKYRCLHLSESTFGDKLQMSRQAKMMLKFYGSKSKKWQVDHVIKGYTGIGPPRLKRNQTLAESRRNVILNSLLLQKITGILATGDVGSDLEGLGIEITRIQVSPRCDFTNIFWVTSTRSTEKIAMAEKKLKMYEGKLRHILCSERVLGHVPVIAFVEDKSTYFAQELEEKMKIADYGEDFIPSHEAAKLQNENVFMSSEEGSDLSSVEDSKQDENAMATATTTDEDISALETAVSNMRMDVYGLDHQALMQQVRQKMKKARGECRREATGGNPTSLEPRSASAIVWDEDDDLGDEDRKEKMQKFIHAQKKAKLRKEKEEQAVTDHTMQEIAQEQYAIQAEDNTLQEVDDEYDEEDWTHDSEQHSNDNR